MPVAGNREVLFGVGVKLMIRKIWQAEPENGRHRELTDDGTKSVDLSYIVLSEREAFQQSIELSDNYVLNLMWTISYTAS